MPRACHRFWRCYKTLTCCSLLARCRSLRLPRKTTSEPSKVVRACGAFNVLTWKFASRHNSVHFFDISTSKSGPTMVCFVHFDLDTCLVPQRRTLFRRLNFQKYSQTVSSSRHNDVHFFDITTSKSGPTLVCFVRFDLDMCFAPQRRATFHLSSDHMAPHPPLWQAYFSTLRSHKSWEKHSVARLCYLFAHPHLCLLTLSLP